MTDHTGSFSSLSFEKNTPGKRDIAWGVLFLYREPFDQCGGYFDFYGVGDGGFDLPDQLASGLAGADHQNAVPLALLRADPRHQLAHESVGEPQRRGGHEAHDKARKVEGAGHIDLQDQHIGHSGCQQHAIGQNDAEQLVDADKAPDAVIQPE